MTVSIVPGQMYFPSPSPGCRGKTDFLDVNLAYNHEDCMIEP
jgi:hypothetical protein